MPHGHEKKKRFNIPSKAQLGSDPFGKQQKSEFQKTAEGFQLFAQGVSDFAGAIKDQKEKGQISDFNKQVDGIITNKDLSLSDQAEAIRTSMSKLDVSPEVREHLEDIKKQNLQSIGKTQDIKIKGTQEKERIAGNRLERLKDQAKAGLEKDENGNPIIDPKTKKPIVSEEFKNDAKITAIRESAKKTIRDIFIQEAARDKRSTRIIDDAVNKKEIKPEKIKETQNFFAKIVEQGSVSKSEMSEGLSKVEESISADNPETKGRLSLELFADKIKMHPDDLVGRVIGNNPKVKNMEDAWKEMKFYMESRTNDTSDPTEILTNWPDIAPEYAAKSAQVKQLFGEFDIDVTEGLKNMGEAVGASDMSISEFLLRVRTPDVGEIGGKTPEIGQSGTIVLTEDDRKIPIEDIMQGIKNRMTPPEILRRPRPEDQPELQQPQSKQQQLVPSDEDEQNLFGAVGAAGGAAGGAIAGPVGAAVGSKIGSGLENFIKPFNPFF